MAIPLDDSTRVGQQKNLDAKYDNDGIGYTSVADCMSKLKFGERSPGQVINIAGVEYWFPPNTTDLTLEPIVREIDITGKVDKIIDKGLSTNDYDDIEKAQVAANFISISNEIVNRTNADNALIIALKDGVATEGDSLQKLYNLIISGASNFPANTIQERDALNVKILDKVLVDNDGDGNWALYMATSSGVNATYIKISDPDLLNAILTNAQIKISYESNPDTNAFTNILKSKLDSLPTVTELNDSFNLKVSKIAGFGLSKNNFTDLLLAKLEGIQDHPTNLSEFNNDTNFITLAEVPPIPEQTIDTNIVVSLSNGKTLGRYVNGETIPSAGKTPKEVFILIAQEAINPTLSLTSPTVIQFNQTAISNVLNFTRVVNSLGATVATASLEHKRNNSGAWIVLSTTTVNGSFTHSLTDTDFNTQVFNYRYIVTDSSGGTTTVNLNITPLPYSLPSRAVPINSVTRELGNVSSSLVTSIVKNSPLVNLVSCKLQRQINNGPWVDLQSSVIIPAGVNSFSTSSFLDNTASVNSTSINYRLEVVDSFATNYSSIGTISLVYKSVLGYNTASSISLLELLSMGNQLLTNSKGRTITATATGGAFTYYGYNAAAGDLTGIVKDGTTPDLGAWTKLVDLTGINSFGATVTYRVYKTNSTNAYTGNILTIS